MVRIKHAYSEKRREGTIATDNVSINKKKTPSTTDNGSSNQPTTTKKRITAPAATSTSTSGGGRKKRRRKSGSLARREAAKYGKSTNLLLNRTSIRRLIRNRIKAHNKFITTEGRERQCIKDMRLTNDAVFALHSSVEDFLQRLVTGCRNNIEHFNKKKLRVIDLEHQYQMQFPGIYGGLAGTAFKPRSTSNSVKGRKTIIPKKNNKSSSNEKKKKEEEEKKKNDTEKERSNANDDRSMLDSERDDTDTCSSSNSEHTPTPWQEMPDEIWVPEFV